MLKEIFEKQKEFGRDWANRIPATKQQLIKLREVILASEQQIYDALKTDLNKDPIEVFIMEFAPVLEELEWFIENFDNIYTVKEYPDALAALGHRSTLMREPYGTMMVFTPHNYPFNLALIPIIGAIATSNTVILKSSRATPAINAVMREIVGKVFPPEQCYILSPEETNDLNIYETLYALDFDFAFFTGSTNTGRKVYEAYAPKLIPVILELGGKSPIIVDETADLKLAARRILWGKITNDGQTCVAPDYVMVHESQFDAFAKALEETLKEQFPTTTTTVAHLSSARAVDKIDRLSNGLNVIYHHKFNQDQSFIIADATDALSHPVMNVEIFGPILPLIRYKEMSEVYDIINRHPYPLALYIFTKNDALVKEIIYRIKSGGVVVNDVMIHFGKHLPFGGIKDSGVGHYHKEFSVESMMHEKAVVYTGDAEVEARYQPYTREKFEALRYPDKK